MGKGSGMSGRMIALGITIVAAVGTVACSASTPATPTGPAASFKTEVAPLLAQNCQGCHAPGGQGSEDLVIFSPDGAVNYDNVSRAAGNILRNTRSGKMPRGRSPLSADQVAIIQSWQAAGAPNN